MYNEDTEILFPNRAIPDLSGLRGATWDKLVARMIDKPADDPEITAFVLMMARVDGCLSCNADSFRAMKGCTACAQDAIRRFRGDDKELLALFDKALAEVRQLSTE